MNKEKIALITGANKGIGASIAKQLASEGFNIWLNYYSDDIAANKIKLDIEKNKVQCVLLKFDVADYKVTNLALSDLLKKDTPFVVVNNAGFTSHKFLVDLDFKEWEAVIAVTLNGFFNITKPIITKMIERKQKGRIINIASMAAHGGQKGFVHYATAKAGLVAATRSLAMELAQYDILVNAVSPGFIETDRLRLANLPLAQIAQTIPLKRLGLSMDVSNAVSFLVSNKSSYITGQEIHVNGGYYM